MGCGMGMIKYLLFIFNFIFAVCGLAILAVGIVIHLQLSDIHNTMKDLEMNISFPAIALIVVGSIIFVISFFGCCGAIRESHCMTVTFASFLLFILLVQVAIAVYAFVVIRNNDEHINIKEAYTKLFQTYYINQDNQKFVDIIQSKIQCCGINGPSDFSKGSNNFPGTIPGSCCGQPQGSQNTCPEWDSYKTGCVEQLKTVLSQAGTILGSVAIGIAGVELIGIIFALCLANSIRNAERRGYRV